jgi:glycosyltransferase involved in cell wall biosynthesis
VIGNGIEVWEISDRRVRSALCSATKLLAISEFTRGRMAAALQIAPQAISVFPCTFDQHRYVPGDKPPFLLDRYRLSREQPIILTIARLAAVEQYKGYDQVLRALPGLRARFPEIRYILGGKGPDRPRVEELAATLGVKENVIFPGYIPDDELCSYYNLCDVFAMPSRGEGFGIVFLEAASCGKAVLAGNKDGSVDALLGGEIGALVDPEDVEEIELTLAQLLTGTHPNCNLRDPVFLRARAIDALGYERFVERVREVLKSIYSKTRARSS